MSNSKTNIAAATTEAVISWRDGSNERKNTDANGSLSSLTRLFVKDGKKRNVLEKDNHVEDKSDETIEASLEVLIDDSSSVEATSCRDDLSTSTPPTNVGNCGNTAWLGESPSSTYSLKPELWDTIATICIELNEKANNLYVAGQYESALETLHRAERQRQKLVDLAHSDRYAQMYCQIDHNSLGEDRLILSPLEDHVSMLVLVNTPNDAAEDDNSHYIYQRSDFDEGMHFFEGMHLLNMDLFSVADTQSDSFQVCPVVEATITYNIGQVFHRIGNDMGRAYKCYTDALCVIQHASASSSVDDILISILNNLGYLTYHRGHLNQAKEIYSQLYHHVTKIHGPQHSYVASALNCLGVVHYHSKEKLDNATDAESSFVTAMKCFKEALAILENLDSETNDADRATVMNNCGRIHVQNNEFDKSLSYYEDALRIRRDCLGMNSLDYAATCFNAGQSYHQKRDLDRAQYLYKEFLRVALLKFGRNHRDVAVVLSGMAQIAQEKHLYDEAEQLYEESLSAGREALGDDHTEIAMLLNRLGNFHFERERLGDALSCYRRGLAIEKKVLPFSHPNILVTLSNIGEICRQMQNWDEAAEIYVEYIGILRRKHGINDHVDTSNVLQTLGLIEYQRGNSPLALEYLEDSLSMRRRLLGNDHVDVSTTLLNIADILSRRRNFTAASELLSEALKIRESACGRNSREVAFVIYNIGLNHSYQSRHEAAILNYSETLRIEKAVLGERHRDVAMTLFKLGEAHKAASNLDAALKSFLESVSILRSPSDVTERAMPSRSDQASIARTLNEIGNIHRSRGDIASMMEALNEASRLYRQAGLNTNNVVLNDEQICVMDFSLPTGAPAA